MGAKLRSSASVAPCRNEQYYEAILSIWNQLYINVKSLIAWQYCVLDLKRINSLTISMVRGQFTHQRSSCLFLSSSFRNSDSDQSS